MKKKYFQATASFLFSILLFVAFTGIVFLAVTSKTDKFFGLRSFVVLTGSMMPTYPVGSIVVTKPTGDYTLGDAIAFTRKDVTITHRIISYKSVNGVKNYIVKGDANNAPDVEIVPEKTITGKVVTSVPLIGLVLNKLHSPIGLFLAVFIPAMILIVFEAWTIKCEYELIVEKKVRAKISSEMSEVIRYYMNMNQTLRN